MVVTLYADASVLSAVALRDDGWAASVAVIAAQAGDLLISDFGWGEFISALGARVRVRQFRTETAERLIEEARADLLRSDPLPMISADVTTATDLVGDFPLALKLPDAIHIAVARRLGAVLFSSDRQQVTAARKLGLSCINPLEET